MIHLNKTFWLITVLLLVLAACTRPKDWNEPARIVGKTAILIADFSLPPDYEPEFGLHALGYTAVAYKESNNNGHLYLVQSEKAADGAALKQALQNMVPGYRDEEENLVVVEQRPFSIRGRETTLTISEGTGWDGEPVRQATAVFQGKEGPALLILREPVSRWQDAIVVAFLKNMR